MIQSTRTVINPLLSPDKQGFSFLWSVTALDSWLPIKTPPSPSERHIFSACVHLRHVENTILWTQRQMGILQAALH